MWGCHSPGVLQVLESTSALRRPCAVSTAFVNECPGGDSSSGFRVAGFTVTALTLLVREEPRECRQLRVLTPTGAFKLGEENTRCLQGPDGPL